MNRLQNRKHITIISTDFIYCWSNAADYEYFIRFENDLTQDIIDEIEKELEYYGCPEDALEDFGDDGKERYEYYFYSGYVEVVTDKLSELGIHSDEYDVFTKMEKEN